MGILFLSPKSNCQHNYVNECPSNQSSWKVREGEFCNCSSNTSTYYYHCLLTVDGNSLIEACLESILILQGNCPVFGWDNEISFKSCLPYSSCPNASYQSSAVNNYPECFIRKSLFPELDEPTTKDEYSPIHLVITSVISIVLLIAMLIGFFVYFKKRRRRLFQEPFIELSSTVPPELMEIKILLLGPTCSGKSSTGNTILNKLCFKTGISSSGITFHCQEETAYRFGRKIVVLDTPGLSNLTKIARRTGFKRLGKPDAVLLVLDLSRFSIDLEEAIQNVTHVFGENIFDNMFIVFTREDELQRHCISLQEFINTFPVSMLSLKDKVKNRIKSVNNLKTGTENTAFVEELIKEIENLKNI